MIEFFGPKRSVADDRGQVRYFELVWYSEPCAEIVPEGNAELAAGLGEAEKSGSG
jgi:hypothetical protein